ncbi:hypothetical protein BCO37747_07645 [Burkholderia contaminans]|nr:hypothetical protein BCO37747_07645 [Burkholderia contaminans]
MNAKFNDTHNGFQYYPTPIDLAARVWKKGNVPGVVEG